MDIHLFEDARLLMKEANSNLIIKNINSGKPAMPFVKRAHSNQVIHLDNQKEGVIEALQLFTR